LTTLADTDMVRILTLVGLMIGAAFIATIIIMVVRKKVLSTDQTPATGMAMDDFRRLHASGQLSDEEFQVLKSRMAAKMKASKPAKGSVHDEPQRPSPTQVQRVQRPVPPAGSKTPAQPIKRPPTPRPPKAE
jgi:hypothetical protein